LTQQGKFLQFSSRDVFGYAIGVVLGGILLAGIFGMKTAMAEGVVFLRTTMPSELSANTPPAWMETENIEQRLIDKLYQPDQATVYEVAKDDQRWRVVRMRVTAYCPCSKCCGKFSDGITACNHTIQPGSVFVAADKAYRFQTEMVVPGYNNNEPVQVKDRGRLIKGNRLDVFFSSHRVAQKWGTRYLDVLVREK